MNSMEILFLALFCCVGSLITVTEATIPPWGTNRPRIPIDSNTARCWDPIRNARCLFALNDFFYSNTKTLSAECCEAVRQVEQNPKCARIVLLYPFTRRFAEEVHHYCALPEIHHNINKNKYWWRTDRPIPTIDAESIKCWDPIRDAKCMFKINSFFYTPHKTLSAGCCEAVRQVEKDMKCAKKVFVEPFSQDFANEVHNYCVLSTQTMNIAPTQSAQ